MSASDKDDWKKGDLKGGREGEGRRDDTRIRGNGKTIYWSIAGVRVASRIF